MNNEQQQKFVQSIYDGIFSGLTEAPPGEKPIYDRKKVFMTFEKGGRRLNSADYKDPWSPGNSSGSKTATINFARLANEAPVLQPMHTVSGVRISDVYRTILNAQITPKPVDPKAQKEYDEALKVLTTETKDEETGELDRVKSKLVRDYEANLTAYSLTLAKYYQAYFEAMSTPAGRASWPLVGSAARTPVEIAYNAWRSGEATKVEDAQATIEFSSRNQVGKAFAVAKQMFDTYDREAKELEVGNVDLRSRAMPSDWASSTAARDWPTRSFSSSSVVVKQDSDFSRVGGGASFSFGIFSIGGSGSTSSSRESRSVEASNLSVSFKYSLVTFDRPWLTQLLLDLPGWNLGQIPPGKFSNGTRNNNVGSLPLIPQAFIVTRDLTVKANWSKNDIEIIKKATSGSASVGIGPFSIGGGGGSSSSSSTTKFNAATGEILVPSLQIIGWINTIVPFCPPSA
ncbi:hypothetical protein [Calothrix sp. PCC 7507]|uniref:hypothetical protein n=1 Tax=Calothrix sp. PCC 7507 TaxID=99598 RepID=UPI00029F385A|nr:hypothetical protein [Calothrix sp. PCC 7507]AFY36077.1 hypothetical protein Cal7507_5757 [Calothrix sp. PCC 7507]